MSHFLGVSQFSFGGLIRDPMVIMISAAVGDQWGHLFSIKCLRFLFGKAGVDIEYLLPSGVNYVGRINH